MTEQMLESQLAALEEPEDAIAVDIDSSPAEIAAEIRTKVALAEKREPGAPC